jgi:hypothetical protein
MQCRRRMRAGTMCPRFERLLRIEDTSFDLQCTCRCKEILVEKAKCMARLGLQFLAIPCLSQ